MPSNTFSSLTGVRTQNQVVHVVHEPDALTPVQQCYTDSGTMVWVKRDDLFQMEDFCGGVARDVWSVAQGAPGLTTCGGTNSTQIGYVAKIARYLQIPCRVFVPHTKTTTAALDIVHEAGGEIVMVSPGYTNVLLRRAQDDAAVRGWRYIPYAHEVPESIEHTRYQTTNLAEALPDAKRLVMAVGCGMTLAGVLQGLEDLGRSELPVLGVVVGADPSKRLDRYAPWGWRMRVSLVDSTKHHHSPIEKTAWWGIELDAWFEAKAAPFVEADDIFWVICTRFPEKARESAV